jgi:polyferredoxin
MPNKKGKKPASDIAELKKGFIIQVTALMTIAFGLVAALAWNNAIQSFFKDIFGSATTTLPMVIYAVIVTVIAVVVVFYLSRLTAKFNK